MQKLFLKVPLLLVALLGQARPASSQADVETFLADLNAKSQGERNQRWSPERVRKASSNGAPPCR